ncbi:MAG: glutathione S-transferase family protein [Rhodospirillales bacterium]|nr:glutathione S-transferase family protein [Rhodospirillales bacterium]MBO6787849.1 glutathione S-transferase family protein [Rhodospirillales bacterium]
MPLNLQLVIGNRNYSSWSLRAWLAMRQSNLPFDEIFVPLNRPETDGELEKHSPSRLVPVLKWNGATIWDSLAIIETLAEMSPDAGIWPADAVARAVARSVCAEMHSGFFRLRRDMPMDIRTDRAGTQHTEGALADVAKIAARWAECRDRFGDSGAFLFGAWSAADIMYAPVVSRFRTYGVPLDAKIQTYMDAVWNQADMAAWVAAARDEPYEIELFS